MKLEKEILDRKLQLQAGEEMRLKLQAEERKASNAAGNWRD